jgi:hypothetical protein
MASTSFNCSVNQGFNFEKDSQSVVGHLTSLKIGTTEFAKDIEIMDPTAIKDDTKVKVVGVISGIYWNGGYADPLSINCQVSTVNKQDSVVLQHSDLSDTTVEYDYVIYDYDPVAKVYFKTLVLKWIKVWKLYRLKTLDFTLALCPKKKRKLCIMAYPIRVSSLKLGE